METQIKAAAEHLSYLAGRWRDESQYEDFADYRKSMSDKIAELFPAATNITLTKRPFSVRFGLDSKPWEIFVKRNYVYVRRPK